MRQHIAAATAFSSLLTLASIGPAIAYNGEQLAHLAKVPIATARQIALRTVPHGKIVDQELEKEPGGSGLRYSFDVQTGKVKREVGVDAMTGKILENKIEGPNPD